MLTSHPAFQPIQSKDLLYLPCSSCSTAHFSFQPQAKKLTCSLSTHSIHTFFDVDPFSSSTISPSHNWPSLATLSCSQLLQQMSHQHLTLGILKPQRRKQCQKTLCTDRNIRIADALVYVSSHFTCKLMDILLIRNNAESNKGKTGKIGLSRYPRFLFRFISSRMSESLGGSLDGWAALHVLILFHFIACMSRLLTLFQARTRLFCHYKDVAQPNPHPVCLSASSYGHHVNMQFRATRFVYPLEHQIWESLCGISSPFIGTDFWHKLLHKTSKTVIYRKAWLRGLFIHSFLLQKLINITYNDNYCEISHTFEHVWRQFLITVRSNRYFLLFALSHYLPLALHNCIVPIMFWQRFLTFNQGPMLAFNQPIVIFCITELNFSFLLFPA